MGFRNVQDLYCTPTKDSVRPVICTNTFFKIMKRLIPGAPFKTQSGSPQETFFLQFFFIVCFTSYFVFSIAVLPHSPGVVYYHLLLRRETRIPGVAPFSFRIGIWDLFVHRGQKSYTPTAFGKLWTTPRVVSATYVRSDVPLYWTVGASS